MDDHIEKREDVTEISVIYYPGLEKHHGRHESEWELELFFADRKGQRKRGVSFSLENGQAISRLFEGLVQGLEQGLAMVIEIPTRVHQEILSLPETPAVECPEPLEMAGGYVTIFSPKPPDPESDRKVSVRFGIPHLSVSARLSIGFNKVEPFSRLFIEP